MLVWELQDPIERIGLRVNAWLPWMCSLERLVTTNVEHMLLDRWLLFEGMVQRRFPACWSVKRHSRIRCVLTWYLASSFQKQAFAEHPRITLLAGYPTVFVTKLLRCGHCEVATLLGWEHRRSRGGSRLSGGAICICGSVLKTSASLISALHNHFTCGPSRFVVVASFYWGGSCSLNVLWPLARRV